MPESLAPMIAPPHRPADSGRTYLCQCNHACKKIHPGGQWLTRGMAKNHETVEALARAQTQRRGGPRIVGLPQLRGRTTRRAVPTHSASTRGRGAAPSHIAKEPSRALSDDPMDVDPQADPPQRLSSPDFLEDLYGAVPVYLRSPQPQSPVDEDAAPGAAGPLIQVLDRELGLYDDPHEMDQLQQDLEQVLVVEDDEPRDNTGGTPDIANQDCATRAEAAPGDSDAAREGYDVAVPGISRREDPLLAHALHLPELPVSLPPLDVYRASHPLWFIRVVLLLVAFLHTHHHVTFRAADLILVTLRAVFVALGLITTLDPMPCTLTTTLKRLDLADKFHILIECPTCRLLFKPDIKNVRLQCFECKTPLFTSPPLAALLRFLGRFAPIPIPRTVAPIRMLSAAIAYLVGQPGIEGYLDAWKTRSPPPAGEYHCIQDGRRWKTMLGADNKLFFGADHDDEIRIPVILHCDWFSAASSAFSASYSTGAFSFSLPTLPPALRYRVEYLILTALTDGPKEPDAMQLQHWISLIVDDLLMLYYLGICSRTPSAEAGRRCRVVVICTCTDHPAMCKVGGFADKSHKEVPCTAGTSTTKDLFCDEYLRGGCPPRIYRQHLEHAREWKSCESKKEREEHFKEHGSRWAEMMRLPYYDCIQMTVIDPMHNLLLGVVKTQWYSRWIQPKVLRADTKAGNKRELSVIHEFLESFEAPSWVGRLPLRVGEPAGGSLTADEYRHLIVGPGCLVLPLLWHHFLPEVSKEHTIALKKYKETEDKHVQAVAKYTADLAAIEARIDGDSDPKLLKRLTAVKARRPEPIPSPPKPRMQQEEVRLVLQLATALKLLLAPTTTAIERTRGSSLLYEYLVQYKHIYGDEAMVPNHHYASHIPQQLEEFATIYEIWAFLAERLNKYLKGTNLNNRRGGQQEVTMMREYLRDISLRSTVAELVAAPVNEQDTAEFTTQVVVRRFLNDTREARGTSELAATICDSGGVDIRQDALLGTSTRAGTMSIHPELVPMDLRDRLLEFYNNANGLDHTADMPPRIYRRNDHTAPRHAIFLDTSMHTLHYVVVNRRRITPRTSSAIVKATLSGPWENLAGDVIRLFLHHQTGYVQPQIFAQISWMVSRQTTSVAGDPWIEFPELEVRYWGYQERVIPDSPGAPPSVIPISAIQCQLARGVCAITKPRLWITTTLEKAAISIESLAQDVDAEAH